MSVTVVNEWCFKRDNDTQAAMTAIREYMDYLSENETGLEQSLWLQVQDEPLRWFHIATYRNRQDLDAQIESEGTLRFVKRIQSLIDADSVRMPVGAVMANTGRGPGEV